MKIRMLKTIVCLCISVVLSTLGLSAASANEQPVKNSTVTTQKKMTQEDWMNLQNSTVTIHTPFGQFNRIATPEKLPSDEIAYSVNAVTAKTKQIITKQGVFLKLN